MTLAWTTRGSGAALCLAILILLALHAFVPPPPALAQTDEAAAEAAPAEAVAEDEGPELPEELLDPAVDPQVLEYRLVPLTKGELAALAGEWLQIVKAKTEEVARLQVEISQSEGNVAEAKRDELTELVAERKKLFNNYDKVVAAWEKKGGDEAAVADYRAYKSSIIIEETRTADFRTLMNQALAWLVARDGGIELGLDIAIVVGAFLVLLIVARIVRRVVGRYIGRIPNLSKLLQAFLIAVIYWLVLAIGIMVVLSALGVDVSPVFALIGGASFIMAFAFQDTLGNLASGLMIMINKPFDQGDYVDVGGVAGTVKSVSIVATTVTTPDNQLIVIPNKNVWGNVITNVTASATRRVDLVFGISYDDSIPDAIRVMHEAVRQHPLVLAEPAPVIRVNELADSSVNFICRPWTKTGDYWTVYWDLTQRIKESFDAAGISIPYPQQDVHVKASAAPGYPQLLPEPSATQPSEGRSLP
ncbi:MAG: mechanosensitive ion channel [Geminicoccaceae bacterium]|jgi:small conductance mechanosensitive channel|nr:mechanosensitive ion channel [Geminicoccaceae bacterium]